MARAATLAVLIFLALAAAPADAIVGGRPATEPYPFAASLELDGEHICGASLLAPDRVLTAAHCVEGTAAGRLSVVLGRTDLTTAAGREHPVAAVTVHPAYAPDEADDHDVAVLRLAAPSALSPVRLAGAGERHLWAPGAAARVVGWGTSFFLVGPAPDDLHEVDVPVVPDAMCARAARTLFYEFDPQTMVCAGEEEGLRDSCQGDSGGPLIVRGSSGWLQVGTVSFGVGCGLPLFYGVYGRVADDPLRGWIAEQAGLDAGARTSPAPPAPPAPIADAPRPRLAIGRSLGSARAARRRRAVRVRLTTTAPVTGVRVLLVRRGRVVARGRLAQLERRATLRLPVHRVAPGRMRVRVRATDAAGRPVRAARRARVRR